MPKRRFFYLDLVNPSPTPKAVYVQFHGELGEFCHKKEYITSYRRVHIGECQRGDSIKANKRKQVKGSQKLKR